MSQEQVTAGQEPPDQAAQDPTPQDSTPRDQVETLDVAVAELRPALEAILMVSDQPLDRVSLASAVGHPVEAVSQALESLAQEYTDQGRGFELRNVAGGWRFYTREEYAGVVEAFVLEGQQARLTQAALETLAVVAYKQPVSRARVSAIRGVSVDGVMRTLLSRGLVEEAGSDETSGAHLYRTTSYFLERIGITSLHDLPELAPYLPDMDDMEEELAAASAGSPGSPSGPGATNPAPEHQAPEHQAPEHHAPHSGDGTEPDGGTEVS
ncbi:SMC-Scp complex subunit ScpB [Nocardioides houyundeii]|uniref:SMC-Scp complex subunit ScpB n=1 Tax=Nocardioides houyundeii TaxID=2045452 RepID=UPI000DF19E4E|nr:SMC-Scp complex subunit ScpB [Nocardioides houyundeii]